MKKKIYFKPETEVVEIELQQMIALSRYDDPATGDDALSRQDELEEELEDDYGKSRRSRNCWDDEDEREDDRW